jgi:hypothetical protein
MLKVAKCGKLIVGEGDQEEDRASKMSESPGLVARAVRMAGGRLVDW